jgi:hypothetical protein
VKPILFLLLIVTIIFQAVTFPVSVSSDWCNVKLKRAAVTSCVVRPDSLGPDGVHLDLHMLRGHSQPGIIVSPDKKSLRYRNIKPVNTDPEMVKRSFSELIMK